MTHSEIREAYFHWMVGLVCSDGVRGGVTYHKLLRHLDETVFYALFPMDENRIGDGIELRYRFGYEKGIDSRIVASELDISECSILEMMIALSLRMEETIMSDPDIGDRIGQWFWEMIVSLGLGTEYDGRYKERKVDDILRRFLDREYEENGSGGLFTIDSPRKDMTKVEIWYQMNWYLNTVT